MSKNVLIQIVQIAAPAELPAHVSTKVTLTDSSGSIQTASLTGAETPPWSIPFTIAEGAGTFVVEDLDVNGMVISSLPAQAFDTGTSAPNMVSGSATLTIVP